MILLIFFSSNNFQRILTPSLKEKGRKEENLFRSLLSPPSLLHLVCPAFAPFLHQQFCITHTMGDKNAQPVFDFSKLNFDFGGATFQPSDPSAAAALGKLIGKSSGYLETLPKAVQQRIKALQHLDVRLITCMDPIICIFQTQVSRFAPM